MKIKKELLLMVNEIQVIIILKKIRIILYDQHILLTEVLDMRIIDN